MDGDAEPAVSPGRLLVILNPAAGRGRARRRQAELLAALGEARLDFELARTQHPGHARELAAGAVDFGTILAAGGDGTVHEVVNGLMQGTAPGERVGPLAILPCGSGDDFAASAGCTTSARALVQALVSGRKSQAIDLGRVELLDSAGRQERHFTNHVGIGFDAAVNLLAKESQRLRGLPLYLWATLRALLRVQSYEVAAEYLGGDGGSEQENRELFLLSVCNSRRVGGGISLTPDARVDDGVFDALRVLPLSRLRALALLGRVLGGRHLRHPAVALRACTAVVVAAARGVPVAADGEVLSTDATELRVEVLPGRLRLCTGSAGSAASR